MEQNKPVFKDLEIQRLEQRVFNLEAALVGFYALTKDTLPFHVVNDLERMFGDFYISGEKFGAYFTDKSRPIFPK
jgi:hypothetical protein